MICFFFRKYFSSRPMKRIKFSLMFLLHSMNLFMIVNSKEQISSIYSFVIVLKKLNSRGVDTLDRFFTSLAKEKKNFYDFMSAFLPTRSLLNRVKSVESILLPLGSNTFLSNTFSDGRQKTFYSIAPAPPTPSPQPHKRIYSP